MFGVQGQKKTTPHVNTQPHPTPSDRLLDCVSFRHKSSSSLEARALPIFGSARCPKNTGLPFSPRQPARVDSARGLGRWCA